MKKIVSYMLLGSFLAAQGLYAPKNEVEVNNLNKQMVLKVSTQNRVQTIDINGNYFSVNDNNKIKIFNINERELIKTIPGEKLYKTKISTDGSKIIALSKDNIFILDSQTFNVLTTIKGNFYNFIEKNNLLVLIDNGYQSIQKFYNLQNGKEILTIKSLGYIIGAAISPNMKKVALNSNNKIFIYDMKGNLLNTIDQSYLKKIKWSDNSSIIANVDLKELVKFDVITSNILSSIQPKHSNYHSIDNFNIIDSNNVLILDDNKAFLYNFSSKKPLKKYILSENSEISDSVIKNNYLGVAYYKNSYLYKINLGNSSTTQTNSTQKAQISKIEIKQKIEPKIIIKEKIVEKKVYVKPKTNIKPSVQIYASQTSGIVPLKVNFKIIANDEDGTISSYYINLAGKETMAKGNPTKSFSHTFNNPGKFKIMVAVKDNQGAVATKQITIKVREETFEDYKKRMMGN